MKKKIVIIVSIIFVGCLGIFYYLSLKEKELIELETVTEIDDTVNLDNGDTKINWDSLSSSTLKLNNKSVTINEAGIYTLSGSIENGSIIVSTDGDVKLILDNVIINNDSGLAISI